MLNPKLDANSKEDKMLPCLRCGSNKIEVTSWEPGDNGRISYRCECENGHSWDEWEDTIPEAINSWNERI